MEKDAMKEMIYLNFVEFEHTDIQQSSVSFNQHKQSFKWEKKEA